MKNIYAYLILISLIIISCSSTSDSSDGDIIIDPIETSYFPPLTGDTWEMNLLEI